MIKKITAFIFSILLLITSVCVVCADNDDLPILPIIKFSQGDVNRDSKVNIKDATQIQKYLALIVELDTQQQGFADVDGKKGITIKDVTHIQKWIVGLVEELLGGESTTEAASTAVKTNPSETEVSTEISEITSAVSSSTAENTQISSTAATDPEEITTEVVTDPEESTSLTLPAETEPESTFLPEPQPSESVSDTTNDCVITEPSSSQTEESEPDITEVEDTAYTEPASSEAVTDPTEAPVVTDPTESPAVTEPQSTEATQSTTRDPNKPITLPFIPAL